MMATKISGDRPMREDDPDGDTRRGQPLPPYLAQMDRVGRFDHIDQISQRIAAATTFTQIAVA